MRLRLTRYTVYAPWLRSWVLAGSLNGVEWTEIDRQTNAANPFTTASFVVSNTAQFHFVRLQQTGTNHRGGHELFLDSVEFFGDLA
jgi:hypothetical protein